MASLGRLIWATGGSVVINGALLALLVLTVPKTAKPLREDALWVSLETAAEAQTEGRPAEPKPAQPSPSAASQPVAAPAPPTPAMAEAPAIPQQMPTDAPTQTATTDSKTPNPGPPAANPDSTPAGSAQRQRQSQIQTQTATASGGSKHAASYAARVRAHIESFKVYPPQARRRHQTGMVGLTFTIDRQGRVLSAQVTTSSGNPLLDQAALDMLSAAQPLPKPPSDLPGESLRMTFAAEFGLTG